MCIRDRVKEEKKGAFYNKIYLEYVDEEKRNLDEEKELNKEFRKWYSTYE